MERVTHLVLLVPRIVVVCNAGKAFIVLTGDLKMAWGTAITFLTGFVIVCGRAPWSAGRDGFFPPCSSRRSAIFSFLSAVGMRWILISSLVRRPCAWSAYCARSFLARSVTVMMIVLDCTATRVGDLDGLCLTL